MSDYVKKRMEQMGLVPKKSTSQNTSAQTASTQKEDSAINFKPKDRSAYYSERMKAMGLDYKGLTEDDINSYISDARTYISQAGQQYDNVGYGNSSSMYDAYKKRADELQARSSLISRYLNWNRETIGEDAYSSMNNAILDISRGMNQTTNQYRSARDYYSQWETEEDFQTAYRMYEYQQKYDGQSIADLQTTLESLEDGEEKDWLSAYTQQQVEEDKKNLNLDDAQKEIDALKEELNTLKVANTVPQNNYLTGNPTATSTPYAAGQQAQSKASPEESRISELESMISQKEAYLNQAKRIQDGVALAGVVNNADFNRYDNYVSTQSDDVMVGLTNRYGMGYDDLTYEYINDQNGLRDEIKSRHKINTGDGSESYYEAQGYDYLTEDEIAIYNYYYAKEGKEKAEEYLSSIQETLNQRKGAGIFEPLEDQTLMELAFGVAAGLDQFESGMKNLLNFNDDYIPVSATQYASGMVREDLKDVGDKLPEWMGGGSWGQMGYDAITTTANMAPSILAGVAVSMLNPAAGAALGSASKVAKASQVVSLGLMGTSAAGNAYQQALNEGYSKGQARAYGTMVGASEIIMEKVLGGISAFGGNSLLGEIITGNIVNADTALKMIAKRIPSSMISEFSEEYLQEVLTPVFENMILRTDNEVKLFSAEALYSGILGALTAGVMEGPGVIVNEVRTNQTGKNLLAEGIDTQKLAEVGSKFAADTVAYQLAGKVDENTGAYTIGRLFNEIGATLTEQNKADIAQYLAKSGMTGRDAKIITKGMADVVEGGLFTEEQAAILEANDIATRAYLDVIINPNSTVYQRTMGYNEVLMQLAQEKTGANTSRINPGKQGEANAPTVDKVGGETETASEGDAEADGKTLYNGEIVSIKEIANIKDSKMTLRLEDGTEVEANDLVYGSEAEALVYETVAEMGVSAADANTLIQRFNQKSGVSASVYAKGIQEAYQYGKLGARFEDISDRGFAVELSEPVRKYAYNLGKMALETQKASEYNKNTTKTEAVDDGTGEELHLRGGVQRTDGKSADGSVREVGEGAGTVPNRQKETAGRPGDGGKNYGEDQGQVSTKELGVPSGTEERNLSYVNEDTTELKKAKALAKQYGLELVAFKGGNLTVNSDAGAFEARAYIYGNKVVVRADHPNFSLMQLLKHEIGHHKIDKGKVDMKKVYDALVDFASEEYVQYVIESYVAAYATLNGYDADYILEEILCDYEAGMNIFSKEKVPDSFWEMSQEILASDVVKQDSVRGPPKDGKTSRDNKQEVGLYGEEGQAEDHASFLRRVHESARRVRKIGEITVAYEPARALDTSGTVSDAAREFRRLGIKYFYHNGLEYNHNGKTHTDNGAFSAIGNKVVGIYAKAYGNGVEFAGHEAFHIWKQAEERAAYVDVLRDNINFASSVYGIKLADTVLNEYFGGDLSALQDTNASAQFIEELYALVSGQLYSGTHEADLRTMLKDYDAVKAAWDALVQSKAKVKFSREATDKAYLTAVESGDMDTAQKLVDEAANAAGYTVRSYHGTGRSDRVGNVFLPERATSGPMAFFTDSKDIAEHYAKDKADTSLAYDEEYSDYYSQFRVNKNGKSIKVQDLWRSLPFSEKQRLKEAGKHITWDDDMTNIIWDEDATHGLGNWDAYTLNLHKGNAIEALIYCWLESGELFGNEGDFLQVLEMAGIKGVEYRDPDVRYEKVYDTFLNIQNPFNTASVDADFADGFEEWYSQQPEGKYDRDTAAADMWDKNSQTAESFLAKLREDIENGTSYAWTSIPDSMTDYLKYLGHDGIRDTGGKNGGEMHTVWIPFASEQIKSAEPVTYDGNGNVIPLSERFDETKKDIRFSREFVRDHMSEKEKLLEKANRILERENSKLQDDNQYLKELVKIQKTLTGGTRFTKTSVEAAAKMLKGKANANGDTKALTKLLEDFYSYIAKGDEITWESVMEQAEPVVDWLQANAKKSFQREPYAQEVLDLIKGSSFYIDDVQKGDAKYAYGSYQAFRQKLFGTINVSDKANLSLDSFWKEMSEEHPYYFPEDITGGDQVTAIVDVLDKLRNAEVQEEYGYGYDQEMERRDLLYAVYDSYWSVSTLYSVADVKQKEINRLKVAHSKKLAEVRTEHEEQTQELKKHYEKRIEKLREEYRKRAEKKEQKIIEKYQESRKKGIESRQKTAMRHKIQGVVKELNDLLLNESKKRHVPDSLKKAVADALALVNMDTVGAEERATKYANLIAKEQAKAEPDQAKIDSYTMSMENILSQGEKMGQRLKELRDAYEEIQGSDDPDIANAYDPVIDGNLKELAGSIGNTSLRNMTVEQLQDVYDMYKMVLTRVRDANKIFIEDRKETISNLASRVVDEVKRVGGEHKYRAAILDFVKTFGWNNLKPVYAFEHIGSSTLTDVFNNVRAGEDVWAVDVTEARNYYLDKSKKYGYDSWDFKKKYHFESASGIEFELSLEQVLSLYAYSKREQAHDHLRLGGFVFDSNIETYKDDNKLLKYKVNTADAHQITPEILANIIGYLSEEQMSFVDDMQEYLSTVMGAKGNEVTMAMYGVKLFKEKFYFPLKSAKQFMFEQNEVSGEVRIKNSGFTNKVVPKANNPVILSNFMDVWAAHVNDMSMYHAFVLRLEDFNRVFNYNSPKQEGQPPVSVKGTIQNAYGPSAVSYVRQLITDLNGGARTDSTTGIINKMMGLFKKGAVFASLSVVVQQPSAIARAAALVDTQYFIGPKVDKKRHKVLWEEVKKYAPVAIIKEMGYFDTNMGKSTQDFILGKEYSGFQEKMTALVKDSNYRDEILSKAPALADEIAWCSIWEAVKREVNDKYPKMDVKSEAFLKKVGERFTEVIVKTQVYDSVLSRSGLMRSKDTGMKMATAFMAEPTTSINMVADALLQGKRGNRKYARTAIGAVVASQILNSILVSFVYAGRDDDEDKTYTEKYIGTLTGEVWDSLNPAGYIPFIKDIVSIVQGYDVERSDMAIISDLWNAWQNLSKDSVSTYRKVEGFAGSIAQIFGLPVKNIMRDARGIYQTIMSFVNGQQTTKAGIGYSVKSAIPEWLGGGDVSNQNQLYNAYMSGDEDHLARIVARYEDESAVNSAMRSAIKGHYIAGDISSEAAISYLVEYAGMEEDDAYWKIQEWEYEDNSEDEFAKYNKFYEAVQTGANLNAVIKEYTDNGVTTSTLASQITSHFKPQYLEMTTSEKASIKGYLLNAITTLGKTREEAEDMLKEWEFEGEHGFRYSDRGDAYKSGAISATELQNILVTVGGKTEEEAALQVEVYNWQMEGIDIESNQTGIIERYESYCEPAGIDKVTYFDFYQFYNDSGEEGVSYSKTIECMPYINSLPLSESQKTAIALSIWAESTVNKYKLW